MSAAQLVSLTLALLAGSVTLLGLVIVTGRALHRHRDRRNARLSAGVRPWLLELIGGDSEEVNEPLLQLAALDRRVWRAVEPGAISLLGKVSGNARTAMVRLLEQRGLARDALRNLSSLSSVRRASAAHVLGLLSHAEAAFPWSACCRTATPRSGPRPCGPWGRSARPAPPPRSSPLWPAAGSPSSWWPRR
nr:hypothetical protein GCM10020093_119050 [Planobispora longispora]